jgi:hypothetical protein
MEWDEDSDESDEEDEWGGGEPGIMKVSLALVLNPYLSRLILMTIYSPILHSSARRWITNSTSAYSKIEKRWICSSSSARVLRWLQSVKC